MRRNVSGQFIGCQLISKTDGTPVTSGTTTVYVTGDAGTQGAGSVGSGACTHEGNGFWTYAPAQAETNYTHVAFTFVNTSACNTTVQIYPVSYDASGQMSGVSLAADQAVNATKIGGTTQTGRDIGASVLLAASQHVIVDSGTVTTLTNLPAAPADWLDAAAVKADAVTKIQAGLSTFAGGAVASVTGNVGGNVVGSVGSVVSFGTLVSDIATAVWGAGTRTLSSFGTLVADITTAVWGAATRTLTAFGFTVGTTDSATISAIAGYVDTEVAAIKAKTDQLSFTGGAVNSTVDETSIANAVVAAISIPSVTDIDNQLTASHGSGSWGSTAGGTGSSEVTITVKKADETPIVGVSVWVTTDAAGTVTVAGTLETDEFGEVKFMLDVGTYYVWKSKLGYNFTNPQQIIVG